MATLGGDDPLLGVVDLGIAGVIFVAPLVLGGRHDFGRFVFILFSCLAASAWFVRQATARRSPAAASPALWLIGCAALVLIIQAIPLPVEWIDKLSPRIRGLLPLWFDEAHADNVGIWRTLSLTPASTRLSLSMLIAYGLLFVTVAQRIQTHDDVVRLMRWVGLASGAFALLGLLQWAASNGKFLWVYQHPFRNTERNLTGAFANRNHFAHFLILGTPALAAWYFASREQHTSTSHRSRPDFRDKLSELARSRSTALMALLIVTSATVVLTCSRGAAIALLTAAGVSTFSLWRAGVLQGRRFAALAAIALAAFFLVSAIGYDTVTQRLATLTAASLDELDRGAGRRSIWSANLEAINAGGLFGSGAGSHSDIYRLYLEDPPTVEFTHAENGYLQIVTENGILGGLLLLCGLSLCATWSWRALKRAKSTRQYIYAAAGVAALAASAAHSLCDFVWYIPACISVTLVLAACVMRSGQLNGGTPSDPPKKRPTFGGLQFFPAAAVIAIAIPCIIEFWGPAMGAAHWDAYLRVSVAESQMQTAYERRPAADVDEATDRMTARQAALESMVYHLEQTLRRSPEMADAHRQLANRLEQMFELRQQQAANPMPISQIRDAAMASNFATQKERRAWLRRAFGRDVQLLYRAYVHARRAVQAAPLQGMAYVTLADLCFLTGAAWSDADAYIQQARTVSPYDGAMLTRIGSQLAGRGLNAAALQCWIEAFRIRGAHRSAIARSMAPYWPVAQFVAVFAPQWDVIPVLWESATNAPEGERVEFLRYAAQQARQETESKPTVPPVRIWRSLASMQFDASRNADALSSVHKALEINPSDYGSRRLYGMLLNASGKFEAARQQLQWCLARRPNDRLVLAELKRPVKDRIAALAHDAAEQPTPTLAPLPAVETSVEAPEPRRDLSSVLMHD